MTTKTAGILIMLGLMLTAFGVGGIEQFHRLDVYFPTFERVGEQRFYLGWSARQTIQCLMNERIYTVIFFAENLGMVCIGC